MYFAAMLGSNGAMAHEMDRRLLERTIELARQTAAFDWKKLPKALRVAVDSRPLEGAGRVEDTFNLLAHAARKVLAFAARLVDLTPEQIAERANTPLLVGTSVKAALDIEWSDPAQKAAAIGTLVEQLDRLERWIGRELGENATEPPLAEPLATLRQLREQDLDPEPPDGKPRIRKGSSRVGAITVTAAMSSDRQGCQRRQEHGQASETRPHRPRESVYRRCQGRGPPNLRSQHDPTATPTRRGRCPSPLPRARPARRG